MSHGSNHPQCRRCWTDRRGDDVPHRIVNDDARVCCFCGAVTISGIYIRVRPGDPSIPHCTDREDT